MNTSLPNDYFWVKQGNGVRYYLKSTGRIIAKAKIPKEIIDLIPEKDKYLQAVDLIAKLQRADEKIYKQKMTVDTWANFEDPQLVIAREKLVKTQTRRARLLTDYSNFSEEIRRQAVYVPVSQPPTNLPTSTQTPLKNPKEPEMPKVSPSSNLPKVPPSSNVPNTPQVPKIPEQPRYQREPRGAREPREPRYSRQRHPREPKQYKQRNFQPHRQTSNPQTSYNPFEQFFGRTSGQSSGQPSNQTSGQPKQPTTKNDFDRYFGKFRQEFHSPQSKPKESTPPNPPKSIPLSQREKDEQLLKSFGIVDRQDWKTWLKQHHPDKDPNTKLENVQDVNAAAKRVFN